MAPTEETKPPTIDRLICRLFAVSRGQSRVPFVRVISVKAFRGFYPNSIISLDEEFAMSSFDTSLLEAARTGDTAAGRQLLQKGANVNAAMNGGFTQPA